MRQRDQNGLLDFAKAQTPWAKSLTRFIENEMPTGVWFGQSQQIHTEQHPHRHQHLLVTAEVKQGASSQRHCETARGFAKHTSPVSAAINQAKAVPRENIAVESS